MWLQTNCKLANVFSTLTNYFSAPEIVSNAKSLVDLSLKYKMYGDIRSSGVRARKSKLASGFLVEDPNQAIS